MSAKTLLHKINSQFDDTRQIWVLMPSKNGNKWLCVLSVYAGSAESSGECYSGKTQIEAVTKTYKAEFTNS